ERDLDQRVGDAGQRTALDREAERRGQPAQRRDVLVRESLWMAGRATGIEAVHFADRGLAGEPVHEDDVVGVARILHLLEGRKVGGVAQAETPPHLLAACLQQVIERAALPGFESGAFVAAAVLRGGGLL